MIRTIERMTRGRLPMLQALRRFAQNESGATAIEYGLIASLIAIVIITSLNALGTKLKGTFNEITSNLH